MDIDKAKLNKLFTTYAIPNSVTHLIFGNNFNQIITHAIRIA